MPTIYFKKELISRRFIVAGAPVPFEALSGNSGVIALDSENDSALVAALTEAANNQRGGIVSISHQEYDDLKKSRPLTKLRRVSDRREETLRTIQSVPSKPKSPANPAAINPPVGQPAESFLTAQRTVTPVISKPSPPDAPPAADAVAGTPDAPKPFRPTTARRGRPPKSATPLV